MNNIEVVDILGVNIAAINMEETVNIINQNINQYKGKYICISNVHTTIMSTENETYRKIQNSSILSLPDGKPLSILGKKLGYKKIERVTGPELMEEIFHISEKNGYKHYFYGNTSENLDMLIDKLKNDYPQLNIVGFRPSIFRDLTVDENLDLINEVNNSGADFLWVGLGAPRQEIFMYENRELINSLMIGVGGAFNVLAGISPRAPKWMQNMCLEWLFRLIDDPKRLWKRYLITNTKFIIRVLRKW